MEMTKQTLVTEICPTTTQAWVKRGATLVDVREPDEVAELAYNVPNLICITLSEFEDRYTELPKDTELVIVCRSGGRSLRAAGFLINHGYDPAKVVNMEHGLVRWVQKGFPTIGDTTCITPENSADTCCAPIATSTKPKVKLQDIQESSSCCCSTSGCC